jgi:hypothetical protein
MLESLGGGLGVGRGAIWRLSGGVLSNVLSSQRDRRDLRC